jgi:hypothetical protein
MRLYNRESPRGPDHTVSQQIPARLILKSTWLSFNWLAEYLTAEAFENKNNTLEEVPKVMLPQPRRASSTP